MRHLTAALTALVAVACACTGGGDGGGAPTAAPTPSATVSTAPPVTASPSSASPPASPSATASPSPSSSSCPTAYARPYPDRPVVTLSFDVAASKATVTGTERVVFTPDRPVDRLVFRLWANAPVPRRAGGSTSVGRFVVDGTARAFSLGNGGTLLTAPLGRVAPAGTALTIDLDFSLTLPSGANERLGHRGDVAWFGSGFPLLAWQRGRGWATEPATAAFAEAATSEAFRLADLAVKVPSGRDSVLGTGIVRHTEGLVEHREADAVRDVMIAVGPFAIAEGLAEGYRVRVGVAPGLPDDPERLLALHRSAITGLTRRFGPYPYEMLQVAVVPDLRGGVEFPSAILLGSRQDQDATLVHEVAHEWFYGLVGNNQGRDPWLDEAFATYAEALVRGTGSRYLSSSIPASGVNRVGAPMTYWEPRTSAYYRSVYVQGAAMLLRARRAAGAARWDRTMRCYVAAMAYRVATPEDVRRAFAAYPAAVALMRRMGAVR
ncbi:MAG TPA: M1 family aminopeptidase [Frankiaceae bacterium]|jgi:hypothetical protein|nr:M1 family aminopeptidase [Frankiaceae bacterium]